MSPFWRGFLSIFDWSGQALEQEQEDPPPRDDRSDAEKLEADWRKVVDW